MINVQTLKDGEIRDFDPIIMHEDDFIEINVYLGEGTDLLVSMTDEDLLDLIKSQIKYYKGH